MGIVKTGILTKSQLLLLGILVAIIVTVIAFYFQSNSEGKNKASGKLLLRPTTSLSFPIKASTAGYLVSWAAKQLIDKHSN